MDEIDRKFYLKWGWIRQKGKGRYIFTRGAAFGFLLLVMRVCIDAFQQAEFAEVLKNVTEQDYMIVLGGMAILMFLAGFLVAWGFWFGKESRFKEIVKDTPKEDLPYLNTYVKNPRL